MVRIVGRVGASADNAAMESFFAPLQKNVLDRRSWITRERLHIAMVTWDRGPSTGDVDRSAWGV